MSGSGERTRLAGIAAAACVACCIPVVLSLFGGLTLSGLVVGEALFGVAGAASAILIAAVVVTTYRRRRPRTAASCDC